MRISDWSSDVCSSDLQFEIYLQPQITALDKRVTAAEALLRWRHPQGMRLPGDFIGIAEDSGIIVDIGEWTMRTFARTLAAWHRQPIHQRIGLNIRPSLSAARRVGERRVLTFRSLCSRDL